MSNKTKSRILTICIAGVFSALAVVLALLIHLPLIPAVSFLEYDPADVPIFLIAALLGPWAGIAMTIIVSIIQGLTVSAASGWIGIIMHILATGFFVAAECFVLRITSQKIKSTATCSLLAMLAGVAAMTLIMTLWNLVITPYYMNMSLDIFMPFLPYIVLFNLFKGALNGAAAWILYQVLHKPVSPYLPDSH